MGCCYSSVLTAVDDENSLIPSKAMVVATDGSLLEYSGGIRASEVITDVRKVYALCISDELFFNAYPLAMAPNEELLSGQIYFLLPMEELDQRLSGANMAALAIRASAAMKRAAEKQGRRRRIRVAPVAEVFDVEVVSSDGYFDFILAETTTEKKKKGMMMLSTIEEVDEESI